jgi:hypothetical protein
MESDGMIWILGARWGWLSQNRGPLLYLLMLERCPRRPWLGERVDNNPPEQLYGYSHTIVWGGAGANHTIVWEKLYGRLYGINF